MKMSVIKINKHIFLLLLILVISSGCTTLLPPEKPRTFLTDKDVGVAVLSPDNQTVVFSLDSVLYKVNLEGTEPVALDNGSHRNFDPAFSPDGSKIVFCHSENQGDICVINLDGSGRVCLTSGMEHDFEPVYTPDGSKIYFLRAKVFRNYSPIARPAWHDVDIYSINADGSGLKRITNNEYCGLSDLSINPEGDTLMVKGCVVNEEMSSIWMIPINDPTNLKTIKPDLSQYLKNRILLGPEQLDYRYLRNPRLSPDGTHVLFVWPNHRGVYLMDLKTNNIDEIWTWKDDEKQIGAMHPRFSEDGRQVIFSTLKTCMNCDMKIPWRIRKDPELWIINADGTDLRSVEIK